MSYLANHVSTFHVDQCVRSNLKYDNKVNDRIRKLIHISEELEILSDFHVQIAHDNQNHASFSSSVLFSLHDIPLALDGAFMSQF